jgi:hypothetical protein
MIDNNAADNTDADAPNIIAELGPLAYGLFVLAEPGPLDEIEPLSEARAKHLPTQSARSIDREAFQEKLLGELGELDL